MAGTRAKSVIAFAKARVAEEMCRKTPYTVTEDMVTFLSGETGNGVFVAHINDFNTILCKVKPDRKLVVKVISW